MNVFVIGLGLIGGSMAVDIKAAENAIKIFGIDTNEDHVEEVLKMLQGVRDGLYPEQEMQWLLVYCWNRGVTAYRLTNLTQAEIWMGEALKLLQKYSHSKDYQEEMNTGYSELLSKMDSQKRLQSTSLWIHQQK